MLSAEETARYSRHILLPEVGAEGQERLKATSVLIVGAGGLGSPLSMYLAAAGIGTIGIVEFDTVDVTNLQRQILYGHADIGRKKLAAAEARLASINPHIKIVRHDMRLSAANALDLIRRYDIIADGTDNFSTRYLVNDACVLTGRPNVYASIYRFDGQASVFGTKGGPCYRCIYPEPPPPGSVPDCAEGGVLGVLPGIMGSIQAAEVIKLAAGFGDSLSGRLLLFDALEMRFRTLNIPRDPDCPVCGDHPTQTELIDYDAFCGIIDPEVVGSHLPDEVNAEVLRREAVGYPASGWITKGIPEVSTYQLKTKLDAGDDFLLLDVRSPMEFEMTNIGGLLIPLPELMGRLSELADFQDKDIVVICRSGARSGGAVRAMRQNGFDRAFNLRGGIVAWSETIDSSVPRY